MKYDVSSPILMDQAERARGMNLDRYSKPRVVVDAEMCDRLAAIVASKDVPPDEEQLSFQSWPRDKIGNLYLSVVAICHQTSPRGRLPLAGSMNGRVLRGWDYLLEKYAATAHEQPEILSPEYWSSITAGQVLSIFREQQRGDLLSDPIGRAALLRDLGLQMTSRAWRTADDIYDASDKSVSTEHGLLELLKCFRAYEDPVRKKSLFFLALMRNSRLWTYRDNEALGPPVDYHEIRGHLRIGTIRIVEPALLHKVKAGQPVANDEDTEIRMATYQAIMRISDRSGLRDPSRLHYFFWNLFRSICRRERPQCYSIDDRSALPDRYKSSIEVAGGSRCPFSPICESAGSADPVVEHVFDSDYY